MSQKRSVDVQFESEDDGAIEKAPNGANGVAKKPSEFAITKRAAIIIASVIVVSLIGIAVLLLQAGGPSDAGDQSPQAQQIEPEEQRLHKEVSKIAEVPQDQTPSVVNVNDAAKTAASNPQLFKNAIDNDKVLLYTKQSASEKSVVYVLYRPSTQKIVTKIEVTNN